MTLLLFTLALLGGVTAHAQPSLRWRWSNPLPHGNNIVDMIATNGVMVQVSERGQIHSTVDFQEWIPHDSGTTKALRSIGYFKGQFLISGEEGTIVSGSTNLTFTTLSLGTTDWLEGIAASPTVAVAIGDQAAIYTSTNGLSWQRRAVAFNDWLRSVAYGTPGGSPLFVTVGEAGFVAVSTNALQWNVLPDLGGGGEDLNRVAWINNQFWIVGNGGVSYFSGNGRNWNAVSSGAINALTAVAGDGSTVLLAGDNELRRRDPLNKWFDELADAKSYPAPSWTYLSALHDGTSFLVGGRTGVFIEGFQTSGASDMFWLPFASSVRTWLWDVKRFAGLYLAVGDQGTILSSLNGVSWAQENAPAVASASVLLGVGGRTNLALAVGGAGTMLWSDDSPVSIVSTNQQGLLETNEVSSLGIIWNPVSPSPTTNDLQGICAFGSWLIASGGNGTLLTSPDASNWVKRTVPTASFLSSVDASPADVVAVGKDGTILHSTNGMNWTARSSGTTSWIYRVRWTGDRWIAVGQNGTILTSTNATTWTPRVSGTTQWLNDVLRLGDTLIAVGTQGTVLLSTNATNWSNVGSSTFKSLYGAATDGTRLITSGVEGVLLRTTLEPFTTPIQFLKYPTNSTETVFLFAGQTDQRFMLGRGTNLLDWSDGPVLEILEHDGTLLHVESGAQSPLHQFFRAKPVP